MCDWAKYALRGELSATHSLTHSLPHLSFGFGGQFREWGYLLGVTHLWVVCSGTLLSQVYYGSGIQGVRTAFIRTFSSHVALSGNIPKPPKEP